MRKHVLRFIPYTEGDALAKLSPESFTRPSSPETLVAIQGMDAGQRVSFVWGDPVVRIRLSGLP